MRLVVNCLPIVSYSGQLTDCSVYGSIGVVPMVNNDLPGTADAVVVGGGTVGAWCACFLRQAGLSRVVLLEKGVLGQGASSRAAGVVRLQGGTPEAVRLGRWSRDFYLRQRAEMDCDSGFVTQGYLLPCFTEAEVDAARDRMTMQAGLGVAVRWLDGAEVDAVNPTLAPGQTLGGTFCADDGYISPVRNVTAYTAALLRSGVTVAEHVAFLGLELSGGQVTGVITSGGPIATGLVVLTGGPKLAEVGRLAGIRIPAGGARHQVAVTEQHPDLHPSRVPMVFDLSAGLYWRPEEGGLLFGMSNPDEPPGENRSVDEDYLALMRERLAYLVPVTAGLGLRRLWAATIDFTPDHLPIIGPALGPDGRLDGVTVACAGGAGMMWGPAVSRAAADVALTGATDVVDVSMLGLDRFDEAGHSSLAADPVALPFPQELTFPQTEPSSQAPPSPLAVSSRQAQTHAQPRARAPGSPRTRALPSAPAVPQAELPAQAPAS
jgi:sarcosine oxidase subunit beta